MYMQGMKASALIEELKKLIEQHGDRPVYAGGGDYPEGVQGVHYVVRGDGYVPSDSFKI